MMNVIAVAAKQSILVKRSTSRVWSSECLDVRHWIRHRSQDRSTRFGISGVVMCTKIQAPTFLAKASWRLHQRSASSAHPILSGLCATPNCASCTVSTVEGKTLDLCQRLAVSYCTWGTSRTETYRCLSEIQDFHSSWASLSDFRLKSPPRINGQAFTPKSPPF